MALALVGLLLILPAKGTIAYSAPTGVMNPFFELVIMGLVNGNFNPNNLLTLLAGVGPGFSFGLFILIFTAAITSLTFLYTKWHAP
jgi:hypothetical protein